jgi:hypothetical protein
MGSMLCSQSSGPASPGRPCHSAAGSPSTAYFSPLPLERPECVCDETEADVLRSAAAAPASAEAEVPPLLVKPPGA